MAGILAESEMLNPMKPTREQAAYFLPFVQAIAEGKRVQTSYDDNPWFDLDVGDWFSFYNYDNYLAGKRKFRIAPEPTLRPWTLDEVPVGARLRSPKDGINTLISWAEMRSGEFKIGAQDGTGCGRSWDASYLASNPCFEHSTDGGKNWLPCGVLTES